MSRTGVEGSVSKIPNMQVMATPPQARPAGVPEPQRMESGGQPISLAREVKAAEVLAPGAFQGTVVTGHNSDKDIRVRRYRVIKAGHYKAADSPEKHTMYEGKVLDTANYDIKAVQSQGVKVVEIDAEDNEIKK